MVSGLYIVIIAIDQIFRINNQFPKNTSKCTCTRHTINNGTSASLLELRLVYYFILYILFFPDVVLSLYFFIM